MSWIKTISAQRRTELPPPDAQAGGKAPGARKAKPKAEAEAAALAEAGVSEKVLRQYGANLTPSIAEMRQIAATAAQMQPHRATQFSHALERFYGDLGRSLEKLPEGARSEAAQAAIRSLASLVEKIGASERVVAAMTVLSSLLFSRPRAPGEDTRAADLRMGALLDAVEGRVGASTLMLGFRNLIEAAESRIPNINLEQRSEIWALVQSYLTEASPRSGIDQAELARLVGHFYDALEGAKSPQAAIKAAQRAALAERAAPFEVAKKQVSVAPKRVGEDAPGMRSFEALSAALTSILDAHCGGPESIYGACEALHGQLLAAARKLKDEQVYVFESIANALRAISASPAAEAVIRQIGAQLDDLLANPSSTKPLALAREAGDVPRALIECRLAVRGKKNEALVQAAAALDRLPPVRALRAALAVLPYVHRPNLAAPLLEQLVPAARNADSLEPLAQLASRFAAAYPIMQKELGAHAAEVALALAQQGSGRLDRDRAESLKDACVSILAALPGVQLGRLVREPGMMLLGRSNDLGRDPQEYLLPLLEKIAERPRLAEETKTNLARRAIQIAVQLSLLDRDPDTILERVTEDWATALEDPKALRFAAKAGKAPDLRGKGGPSALGFVDAHPELPPELAFTAGVHLSKEQMTWLIDQVSSTRSHAQVRILRDVIFAALEAGKADLIEQLRVSPSPPKASSAAAQHVALEYRQGRINTIPFDRLIRGLKKGGDPMEDISADQQKAALGALNLGKGGGALDPDGLATIARNQEDVNNFLAFVRPGEDVFGVDSKRFREPLQVCLRSIAAGTWPQVKYEDEIGKRQLAGLTPQQREIWAQEGVTPKAQAKPGKNPEILAALPLMRGLVKAIPAGIDLTHPELGALGWDAASRDKLAAAFAEQWQALHGARKGSRAHREAGAAIGPTRDRLAILEAYLKLEGVAGKKKIDPGAMLLELKPLLGQASAAARRLGAKVVGQALGELAETSKQIKSAPREGIFAADEDRLDAYMTSFGGGCLHPSTGFNRGGLVELMASAQYKMGRIMNGEKCLGRTIIRLVQIETGNYRGYALRVDKPVSPTDWTDEPPEDLSALMFKHGLQKAMAMGIPFLFHEEGGNKAARELGLEVIENRAMKVHIDRGHTGIHHCQGFNIGPYFVAWPGLDSYHIGHWGKEKETSTTVDGSMNIVFPPGVKG